MKKLVFSISLILSYTFMAIAGVVKSIPAKADEFTNGNIITVTPSISETDLNTYNNALQVVEYLRQGGSIDFSNVSDDYSAGDLLEEFIDLIDTVGSGIDYYGNNFLNNIFDLSSDTVQLSPNNKLKDRIYQFRSNLPSYLNNQNNNVPDIPSDYTNYIKIINDPTPQDLVGGTSFFWSVNFPTNSQDVYGTWYDSNGIIASNTLDFNKYSYITSSNSGVSYFSNNIYHTRPYTYGYDIFNIYINSTENNQYNVSSSSLNQSLYFIKNGTTYRGIQFRYLDVSQNNPNYTWVLQIEAYVRNNLNANISYTGTLEQCFQYLCNKVKNVNIYVDGVPWSIVGEAQSYNISLSTGTYLKETNQPIEYKFDIPVYVDISDLIDKIDLAIDNKINLDFPYLEDLIVDTNGQMTLAVTVFSEDYTIDDLYVKDYGAMIPLFPLWVEYPVSLEHINTVATIGIVNVIPSDILEILGIFLVVGLFVWLCHRLME